MKYRLCNNRLFCLARTAFACALMVLLPGTRGENWPQWRGTNGDGISSERNLPVEWSSSKNIVWKTAIPGEGHSSPAIWKSHVFLTSARKQTGERLLLQLDAKSGQVIWQRVVLVAEVESMHRENSAASSTPVTDGAQVYTSFQNGKRADVQCHDLTGKRLWTAQPLRFEGMPGYSYTPVLHQDLLILDFAQNDEAAVIALDKNTGKLRWRADRKRSEISHVAPLVVGDSRTRQLIVCGADELRGLNPETGETLWWCQGPTDVCVAGLAYGEGTVFANGGYPKKTRMAVKTSGRGDVTSTHVLWTTGREVSYVPSPVYYQGHLYTVLDDGMLYCFDATTGQAAWEHRLGGRFRSSLVLADQNLYATDDKGKTTVFRATPQQFQSVAVNHLDEFCYATPAISNGRIYLRTGSHLYSIGK